VGISFSYMTGQVSNSVYDRTLAQDALPRAGLVSWSHALTKKHPTIKAVSPIQSASHEWELWSIEPNMQPCELLEYRRPDTDDGYREFRKMVDEKYGPFPNTLKVGALG
jgi:hypothetical protein